jgi:hypothetical protein
MPSDQKLEKLILLLIRETTEGRIKWQAAFSPKTRVIGTDDIIADYFVAEFKEQGIAVFDRRSRGYDPDHDSLYWQSDPGFALLNEGDITWETEHPKPQLWNLLKVARESAADVDNIVDSLLN